MKTKEDENLLMDELNFRVNHVLRELGYKKKYKLQSHPHSTFTANKKDMFICTSCEKHNDIDRLLYMALHETSHALDNKVHNEESHNEEWEKTFKTLLLKASSLGYIDQNKLKI